MSLLEEHYRYRRPDAWYHQKVPVEQFSKPDDISLEEAGICYDISREEGIRLEQEESSERLARVAVASPKRDIFRKPTLKERQMGVLLQIVVDSTRASWDFI